MAVSDTDDWSARIIDLMIEAGASLFTPIPDNGDARRLSGRASA